MHLIMEAEFDLYRGDGDIWAKRLEGAGRLLEYVILPGATHFSHYKAQPCYKYYKQAFDAYL